MSSSDSTAGQVAVPPPQPASMVASRRCSTFARSLALGFGGAVAMWVVAYIAMMRPGALVGEALFGLTITCAMAAGFIAARHRSHQERPWLAAAKAGLVIAGVNMLLIGSLVNGQNTGDRLSQLPWWTVGNFAITIALAIVGGLIANARNDGRDGNRPPRDWFSVFTRIAAVTVFLLLITGGLVTGLEAGLAVPNWPNSFGHNMLLYPLSEMKGGIYYEHAHRLYGMLVGVTAITLAMGSLFFDRRTWMRALAFVYLIMVCVQGYLGGARVAETSVLLAIVHGVFGQITFATICAIAVVNSRNWEWHRERTDLAAARTDRLWSMLLVGAFVLQLALGALYRHTLHVHVLYTHILWAMIVVGLTVFVAGRAWRGNPAAKPDDQRLLMRFGKALLHTTLLQVVLGVVAMFAVLSRPSSPPTALGEATPLEIIPLWETLFTSLHQATGAFLLAAATMLMLWTRRILPGK